MMMFMSANLKDSWFVISLPMSSNCLRARYGLKMAPKAWFDILLLVLLANGFSCGFVEVPEDGFRKRIWSYGFPSNILVYILIFQKENIKI